MENSDTKKYMVELCEALNDETQKYLTRHSKKKHDPSAVLSGMQNAASNYVGKVAESIMDNMGVVEKLDYVESVRAHLNQILDYVKAKARSVPLN